MKKLLSLLLVLATLLSFSACNKSPSDQTPEITSASTEEQSVTFVPSNRYNICRGEFYRNCEEIINATSTLQSAFRSAYGISCSAFSFVSEKDPSKIYEILVGDTGRPESDELLADLSVNDYGYRVVSEHLIVIGGGSVSATETAVKAFCEKAIVAENAPLTVGDSYFHHDTYSYSEVKINGLPLSEITVAVTGGVNLSAADALICEVGRYTGEHLRVVPISELTGNEKGLFVMGAADLSGASAFGSGYRAYDIRADIRSDGFTVFLDSNDPAMSREGMEKFAKEIDSKTEGESCSLTLPDIRLRQMEVDKTLPIWKLQDVETKQIANGVVYSDRSYVDEDGLPYRAHVLEIDPSKAYLYMGTSYDNYELTPKNTQSVNGQMQSAMENGLKVVGGVNADFFDLGGTNEPRGLAIKEGRLLNVGGEKRGYIGFTYDGKVVIDNNPYSYEKHNLRTAVGGSHVILKNGAPDDIKGTDSLTTTSHPRTLAGVKDDGTILLVVVDGRQEKVSNGAPLARCAALMFELGAMDAINLDGGGSSTLSVTENNKVTTQNSPSGGTLRRVYNSLLVVMK